MKTFIRPKIWAKNVFSKVAKFWKEFPLKKEIRFAIVISIVIIAGWQIGELVRPILKPKASIVHLAEPTEILAKLEEYKSPHALALDCSVHHGWELPRDSVFWVSFDGMDYLVIKNTCLPPKIVYLPQDAMEDALQQQALHIDIGSNLPFSISINEHGYRLKQGQQIYL